MGFKTLHAARRPWGYMGFEGHVDVTNQKEEPELSDSGSYSEAVSSLLFPPPPPRPAAVPSISLVSETAPEI